MGGIVKKIRFVGEEVVAKDNVELDVCLIRKLRLTAFFFAALRRFTAVVGRNIPAGINAVDGPIRE